MLRDFCCSKLLISQRHARVAGQEPPDYAAKILDMARRCEAKLYQDATSLVRVARRVNTVPVVSSTSLRRYCCDCRHCCCDRPLRRPTHLILRRFYCFGSWQVLLRFLHLICVYFDEQEEYKDQTSLVSRLKVVVTSMQQARRPTDARTPTAGGSLTPSASSMSLPAHAVATPTNGVAGGAETVRASPPAVSIPSAALVPPNGLVQNGSMAQHWGSSVPNTVGTAFSPVQPPPALPNMPQRPVRVS
jgi:hypothetical protein